jgi:hypothetical protein
MASPALNHFEIEQLKANILADSHDSPVSATDVLQAFASADNANSLSVPISEGLKPARGAMIAIGVEAAAAFGIYAVWQLWHILR